MTVLGQHKAVRLPVEQFYGETFLQFGNSPTHGRMVDLQAAGGRSQPVLPGQLQKINKIVPIEHERQKIRATAFGAAGCAPRTILREGSREGQPLDAWFERKNAVDFKGSVPYRL